jgi:hypothetical protein
MSGAKPTPGGRPLPTGRRHVEHLLGTLPTLDVDRLEA